MAKIKLILIPFLLLASQARADEWTGKDTVWEIVYLMVLDADRRQAQHARGDPSLKELNSVIGEDASKQRIDNLILLAAMAHAGVAYYLPQPYRREWQFVWIGIEIDAVHKNYQVGLQFHW